MDMEDKRTCQHCEGEFDRESMWWTYDCQGITFRLVCYDCYEKLMENGYDGQYYDERDECIDEDY